MSQWSASPKLSSSPDNNNNKPPHPSGKRAVSENFGTSSTKGTRRASSYYPPSSTSTPIQTSDNYGPVDVPQPPNFHQTPPSTPPFSASPPRYDREDSPVADTPGPLVSTGNYQRSHGRRSSRPLSMVITYHPPVMDVTSDTIPELQPIFHFLNGHANKLYQEGYFLKLDDQNTRTLLPTDNGHPCGRRW